ncbi:flagellar export protein FliJ [Alteromonas sp. 5E99-2]|uniref:flagellar export protein FliJ n=1 Tax=Alteromonas sp. 5E99-2 TaxID=2817683 RepID=UPI001A98DFA9|nr:flagellar export protein FliJ [Alteromonas sp. 5E99-2]MBO1255226.1 flagellar export protein FliJ [Alteromonas sp. 5E99-2]
MATSQLDTVLRVEIEREQAAANNFRAAQNQLLELQQKLTQLQQYRIDYIEGIKRDGSAVGLAASRYQQHLSFVGKLDLACEQQLKFISKATLLVDQRRREWIAKQQRKKAIELLLEKKKVEAMQRQTRMEQQLMDEFSGQQFLRRRAAM